MNKHTQPEWQERIHQHQHFLKTDILSPDGTKVIASVVTHKLVSPYRSEPDPEGMANFRLILAASKLFNELLGILRCFDRDDIPIHFEQRPSGKGIRVFITHAKAQRIRKLIKEAQP